MTWPATACRTPCGCAQTTVALPCDAHETVVRDCPACRPAADAVVLDLGCQTHRAAAEWAASGLAHARAA